MKNTFGEEVQKHEPQDCYPCHGTRLYKLPLNAEPQGVEDEANCDCECHDTSTVPSPKT